MFKLTEKSRINDTIYFQIELKTGLSTHEYSINYDITNASVSGDVISYGEIEVLSTQECIEVLNSVLTSSQLKKLWNTSVYRNAENANWFATWFKDSAYTKEQAKISEIVNAGTESVDRKLSKFVDEMVALYNFNKYYGYKTDYIKALKRYFSN